MNIQSRLFLSSIIFASFVASAPGAYAQNSDQLEEIIVTAQKRSQSTRDVAAAISVVSGEHLDEYNILTFQDLERIGAGFSLTQANPRNVTISLRGVTVDPESGTASAVDVYQNNVVQRADNIFGALYDIERVEILRGAQGSVQGQTSPAGAILLHTKQVDLEKLSGYAQSTYGDTNKGLNLQGAVNIPIISDRLGIRVAGYNDENDGTNIVNLTTGKVQGRESTSFRGSLRWQASDNFELNLTHQNNDEKILGTPALAGTRTGANAFAPPAPGIPCAALAQVPTLECISLSQNDNNALAANDAFSNRTADITTLNLDWTLGQHQLSYVYGKTTSSKVSRTENDASNNLPLQNFFLRTGLMVTTDTDYLTHQGTTTKVDADVHEIRFASIDNSTWNYMAGAYYSDQKTTTRFDAWSTQARYIPLASLPPITLPPAAGGMTVQFTGGHIEGINFSTGGVIPFNSKTTAVFTAHSFQFNDKTALEAALRYQKIKRFNALPIRFVSFNQQENISIENAAGTVGGVPSTADPRIAGTINSIANATLPGTLAQIMARANIDGIPEDQQRPSSDAITGTVRFKYDFGDHLKSYISWSRAFREGGISVVPGEALPSSDLLFDDEISNSFEVGAKILTAGGRAEINVALFHQIFDGYLGYVTDLTYVRRAAPTDTTGGTPEALTGGLVYNGDATFTGVDLDWRVLIGDGFQMGGSVNYTKARFDNALVPCNIRTGDEQLGRCRTSSRIPGSQEFSANIFAEYNRSLFFARANAKYNGGILATRATAFDATTGVSDPGVTKAFVLVDLFLGLRHENWEASIWSKNLLDSDALLDFTNPGDDFDVNGDFSVLRTQQERTFGITAKFMF